MVVDSDLGLVQLLLSLNLYFILLILNHRLVSLRVCQSRLRGQEIGNQPRTLILLVPLEELFLVQVGLGLPQRVAVLQGLDREEARITLRGRYEKLGGASDLLLRECRPVRCVYVNEVLSRVPGRGRYKGVRPTRF